jgi:hypothetical protein
MDCEAEMMRKLAYAWRVLVALIYLGVVIGILSVATTRFETLVLAMMVQLYAAVLYNFSTIGRATDANNYAGFVRFRTLAMAQGITENEDGTFQEQEEAIAKSVNNTGVVYLIDVISHTLVSFYALFKIVEAVFFT